MNDLQKNIRKIILITSHIFTKIFKRTSSSASNIQVYDALGSAVSQKSFLHKVSHENIS